jgi:hypothetical protein
MILTAGKLTSSGNGQEPLDLPTSLAWPIAGLPMTFPVPEDIWALTLAHIRYPQPHQQPRGNTH